MGIKVELKQGRRWWYVQVDFGDGTDPVAKGPMGEEEARVMAAELEKQAAEAEGVVLRDKSLDDEVTDRRLGNAAVGIVGIVVTLILFGLATALFLNQ